MAAPTGTVTNWDARTNSTRVVENVGSMSPIGLVSYVPSSADDTAGTVDLTFAGIANIIGWFVEVYESGVKDANQDPTVSASGNVLTIADGSNWTLATSSVVNIMVFGKPRS